MIWSDGYAGWDVSQKRKRKSGVGTGPFFFFESEVRSWLDFAWGGGMELSVDVIDFVGGVCGDRGVFF